MVAKKGNKGGMGGEDAEEELTRVPLQAILLADSFATLFRPITLERPKVLLPLVNAPMIDYTLAWLESAGVDEVFVFCCAHSKQVIDYLENSKWFGQPNFSVTTIESYNSTSAGDALRLIYEKHVIRGDFILVTGDTVSNMPLTQALKEHKERRRKDSNAVMTMVIKQSKSSPITHQSRLGTEELFMAIDPETKQLLYYEDKAAALKGTISLDKALLMDNSSISLHNDKQDCYIDICSPEVLSLFTDNFDYQHLRRHFVKGLLVDDIMGYKIFTHEIHSSYAARIDNYRSYDTISKDIIQRWTYPLVPDVQFFGNSVTKLERQGMYRASDVELSRSAKIGPFTVIGSGTKIGNYTEVSNSVIGEGCVIGSDVSIDGCYIWDKVTIEDGCKLKHAIVCDGVIMKSGAVLEAGVVLSFKVIIGSRFVVPAYSKVSLLQQPVKQDSDEELEYADNSSGNIEIATLSNAAEKLEEELRTELSDSQIQSVSEVGNGGAGFIWSVSEGGHDEEWRHSVAPIPMDRLVEIIKNATDELDISNEDGNILPPSGELEPDSVNDSDEDVRDDSVQFEKEVEATFLRAVNENVKEDHVILEVNSLRLSYNLAATDCAGALFYAMMKLALDAPHGSPGELVKNVAAVITKWNKLLKYYLPSIDEEIEVILKFEEMCLESTKEYSTLFVQILHLLYDKDILEEDAILNWASEKEEADESDKLLLKQAEKFIQWLNEASEEEE
ncbi:Translation initiation factor 2B, epsilon subunit (eIF-2Bepsilon/GCD6) [Handroanthus impetiginosus]|uniref:Translation initiation factor eIF2B subunit epsilon n=1 Tax=Handroanthus impetiginosus TaxID=429701 RepID=A0A2G9HU60_9LAMI|nr:Translation initiation factor 2B, epsilon subunit (eIF-2Bepsilon/GCD6) [Handroanthus impetiginosus]